MAPFSNEQQFKTKFQNQILIFLLRKYERSQAFLSARPFKQRPQFAIKRSPFQQDYYDEMDFMKKVWIHDVLQELEQKELVLSWMRFQEGSELAKVYLNVNALGEAYSLAGIEPKQQKIERMQEILKPLESHHWAWVRQWWLEADLNLAKRKSSGLDLDDCSGYMDLVKVLLKLPDIDDMGKLKDCLVRSCSEIPSVLNEECRSVSCHC